MFDVQRSQQTFIRASESEDIVVVIYLNCLGLLTHTLDDNSVVRTAGVLVAFTELKRAPLPGPSHAVNRLPLTPLHGIKDARCRQTASTPLSLRLIHDSLRQTTHYGRFRLRPPRVGYHCCRQRILGLGYRSVHQPLRLVERTHPFARCPARCSRTAEFELSIRRRCSFWRSELHLLPEQQLYVSGSLPNHTGNDT